jgi:hypothetical protein
LIILNCAKCHKEFGTSPSRGSIFCDDCNGVNEANRQEKLRWDALSDKDKIEELLARVEALERHECNPLIG